MPRTPGNDRRGHRARIGAVGWRRTIIRSLDLRIERGEFVVLLGESGCGKTTLIRALAGLDPIDGGRIDGPARRPAAVFQEHRLLPWDSL
jgi:sulfonate transport system ATP-binding protein